MEQSAHEVANWQYYFAIAVFLVTYGFIISEKLNRAVIALFGAAIMIIFELLNYILLYISYSMGNDYPFNWDDDSRTYYESIRRI